MPEQKKAIRRKNQSSDEDQLVASKKQPTQAPTDVPQFQPNQQVTPQNALQLQRTIGNAAIQRLMIQRASTYPANPKQAPCDAEDIQAYEAFGPTSKAMSNFVEAEFSSENFDCLSNILRYEKNPTPQLARQIYNLFVGEEVASEQDDYNPNTGVTSKKKVFTMTAGFAVNLQNSSRMNVQKKMARLDIGEIPADLFKPVKDDVMVNIADTFSRLKFTPEWKSAYAKFVKSQKGSVGSQIKSFFGGLFGKKKN